METNLDLDPQIFNLEYNDDPIAEELPNYHKVYGNTVDPLLLDNLITDIKWFHLHFVVNQSWPDNQSPPASAIIEELIKNGKYENENKYYKISAILSVSNKTYNITLSPLFMTDEAFKIAEIPSDTLSEVQVNEAKKEIFFKYPRTEN